MLEGEIYRMERTRVMDLCEEPRRSSQGRTREGPIMPPSANARARPEGPGWKRRNPRPNQPASAPAIAERHGARDSN